MLLQEGSGFPGQRPDAIGREAIVSLGHSFGEQGLSVILMFLAANQRGYQNKTFAAGPVVLPLEINEFCYVFNSCLRAYLFTKTPI